MQHRIGISLVALWLASSAANGATLPVGSLTTDGPATPEQLSLVLPVTGTLAQTATATVRYKPSASSTWVTGHPLYRVQPGYSLTPDVGGPVEDVFAWPIIDLTPGASYDVEVTVTDGATSELRTATFTTRALPAAAGPPNKTVTAGSTTAQIQAILDALNPGDVLQFQDGTYDLTTNLILGRSGTSGSPIYIRGASRTGVILSYPNGRIIDWRGITDVIFENLTLRGSGVDSGINASSQGIVGRDLFTGRARGTIRNVTITGVDMGIIMDLAVTSFLVYDNTLLGNNQWTSAFFDTNATWNDDGIRLPGSGNAGFQNTLTGFGDTISVAPHTGGSGLADVRGVHYYRNDIRRSCDDAIEVDYARRNVTFYDNRVTNSMTSTSLDPLYGGPFLAARNVYVNVGRTLHKWNSSQSGMFIYNATTVQTVTRPEIDQSNIGGWYQPNNGSERSYGFRNNIMIYRTGGSVNFPWIESTGHNPIDWTHNSWYPDGPCQIFGIARNSITAMIAAAPTTTPVFSGATKPMTSDNVTVSDPFVTDIVLGANYRTEIATMYTPTLSTGTAPKNSGVVIPNITDGFTGAAPDRGAIISGRPPTNWGDSGAPSESAPQPPTNLTVN